MEELSKEQEDFLLEEAREDDLEKTYLDDDDYTFC